MGNNKVREFLNEMFGEVRVLEENGELWFVASDIAKALNYSDTNAMTKKIDIDDVRKIASDKLEGANSMAREFTLMNESGLYQSMLSITRKDKERYRKAKEFKRWITGAVIPALRKDGMYIQDEEKIKTGEMNEDELILKAMTLLNKKVERLQKEKEELKEENVKMKPLVSLAEKFANTNNTWDIGVYAKIINVDKLGRNNLFRWLKDNKILMSNNVPYQQFNKYFKVLAIKNDYTGKTNYKPMLTPSGVVYIYKRLIKDNKIIQKPLEEVISELKNIA